MPELTIRSILRDGFALLGRFIRHRPWSFAVAVFGAMNFAAAIVAAAVVVGNVTDSLIIPVLDGGERSGGKLWPAVGAIVAVATWKAAGITLRRTGAGWLQFRSQADLRSQMIAHQLELRLGWFQSRSTGDLLSVSDADARQSTFILAPLPYGTGATLLLIATGALITYYDWVLGIVAFTGLLLVVVVDVRGSWRTFSRFEEVQKLRGEVGGVAHESVDGALTVKALGREEYETRRFRVESERLRDKVIDVIRTWANYRAFVEAIPPIITVMLVTIGALRVSAGRLTPGDLVTVAYLMSLLTIPIRLIGFVLGDLSESLAAWRRVQAVLDADDFVTYGDLAPAPLGSGARVDGSAVEFGYDASRPVLRDVTLDIPPGSTVAVVGPTGSGKSTMAQLLARLWDPSSGRIALDGRDLRDFAPGALPDEVALVAQEDFLFDDSVTGNITLGLPIPHEDVVAAATLAAAHGFVMDLPDGYATQIGERGTTLSGGQRQRIALARALIRRPRVMILDDATSAVDPSVETAILTGLRNAELPSTVVVVAYRRSSILLADSVVYVEDGTVVAHGTHAELMRSTPGYVSLLEAYEQDALLRAGKEQA